MIHSIGDRIPCIHATAFIAWNAEVAGAVRLGESSSVWFSAVIRGDIAPIEVGEGSNVQDGAVLHVDTGVPCSIGNNVTVGHGAILHSCRIGDGSVIGMGATVLTGAEIGEASIVGAGALVTQGKKFPPRSLILGSPAKAVRELTEEEVSANLRNAEHYAAQAIAVPSSYKELS